MNFLAHLWLAERTGTSLPGAILGDFVKGPDLAPFPEDLATGIRIHRRVDRLTDAHPAVVQLRSTWRRPLRRYAPILIDLGLDHSLARRWTELHRQPLAQFAREAQAELLACAPWFPAAMRPRLSGFRDLLCSYAEPRGLQLALERTATRLSRPYDPQAAFTLLTAEGGRLDGIIATLLADLVEALTAEFALAGPD